MIAWFQQWHSVEKRVVVKTTEAMKRVWHFNHIATLALFFLKGKVKLRGGPLKVRSWV